MEEKARLTRLIEKKVSSWSRLKTTVIVILSMLVCVFFFLGLSIISLMSTVKYDIGEISLKQDDVNLSLSWNDTKAPGYEMILLKGRERPRIFATNENHIKIEAEELGIEYRCLVFAKDENGGLSSAKTKKIKTSKVNQKIVTEKTEYNGIKGQNYPVLATAHGKISYFTSNPKVLEVTKNGTMKFIEKGEAEVKMSVPEGPQYKAAKGSVTVIVYPDKLESPKPTISQEKSAPTATISWEKIPYAKGYELAKYNPVLEKYEKVKDLGQNDTKAEVVKQQAKYKVLAKADVDGQTVQSELSSEIKVKSIAEDAKTYKSSHSLGTLDNSTLEVIAQVDGSGSASVPQSMSHVGENYTISFVDHGGKKGALVTYSKDGRRLGVIKISGMGHANGSTYCPVTDKIYTVKTHKAIWSPSCTTYKVGDGYSQESFNLPKNTSGIAYDETNNKFYLSKGNELYVTDNNFKVEKSLRKFIRYNHAQDIAAYDGIFFVCTWVSGNESYIDLYRENDGAYLGSFNVPIGEIESCLVEVDQETQEKHLIILMNNGKKVGDCLMRMKVPLSLS